MFWPHGFAILVMRTMTVVRFVLKVCEKSVSMEGDATAVAGDVESNPTPSHY